MALILPAAQAKNQVEEPLHLRRAEDQRRRLNFEFFDQLDDLELSNVPRYVAELLEGAD